MKFEYKALEFNKILGIIAKYAFFSDTLIKIQDIKASTNIEEINLLLSEVDEASKAITKMGDFPFNGVKSIYPIIKKANIDSTCSIDEFLTINNFILVSKELSVYYNNLNPKEFVNLEKYFTNITYFKKLKEAIDKCISYNGAMLDTASSELYNIREKLTINKNKSRSMINDIMNKSVNYFTDNVVAIRNNRMCLPVKAEFKNSFKGIIHDESQSGSTFYIEPQGVIEVNSYISSLENMEKIEIERILRHLTSILKEYCDDLKKNMDIFIELDLIMAKAIYAIKTNSIKPMLVNNGYTKLINAKHPLIDPLKVIPLSIELGKNYKVIIITGPNTGGKSVSLKTVGLLTLMVQCGILIPVSNDSIINIYENIFANIGTEQSIEQSLSTFSASIENLVSIINNVDSNSLVLLDELGSGTDPIEGSNLAIATLNYLLEIGANVISSTHFSDLKVYAYNTNNVINASMEFDSINLVPTYRLLVGVPGKSNAFEIANRLGLNNKILDEAKKRSEIVDDKINKTIDKLTKDAYILEQKIKEYEVLLNNNKQLKDKMDKEYNSYILKGQAEANKIIMEAKSKANEVILELDEARKKEFKEHELANIKHLTSNLKEIDEFKRNEKEIKVSDEVYVIPYKTNGTVLSINKNKYKVSFGNITMDFLINDLSYVGTSKPKKQEIKKGSIAIKKSAKLELDLRGFRYEDAYIALEKFIDDAILSNYSMISIVHGFGTGVIRKMVHEYLKKCPYVKSFRFGGEGEGLQGATIAYLK